MTYKFVNYLWDDALEHASTDQLADLRVLLADAGWQRGPDGILVNAGGERFELENRAQGRDAIAVEFHIRLGACAQRYRAGGRSHP
jgi:hypothetical protein